MQRIGRRMDGLSLHYYTIPTGDWARKGSATDFSEADYHASLRGALYMEPLLAQHIAIMNAEDPDKRVGLMVDEWGIWTDQEPGSTPGFLHQQNSLRDAELAALTFHIFHRHAERVKMANIAQTVNVLQAMILTDGDRMVLTPTYWVFEMFKVHQGGTFLPVDIDGPDYTLDFESIPAVSASATRSEDGTIYLSWVNTNPNEAADVTCRIQGADASSVEGRVLTGEAVSSHNTFDRPDRVKPTAFDGATLERGELKMTLPPKSVGVLTIKCGGQRHSQLEPGARADAGGGHRADGVSCSPGGRLIPVNVARR